MHIGRYQHGDRIPIVLHCLDRQGEPTEPISAPMCVVSLASGAAVESFSMPIADPAKVVGLFQAEIYVDASYSVGSYVVLLEAIVDGHPVVTSRQFEIVAGGNVAGEVQALEHWQRPEAAELVMQLGGGTLVSGRNPSIPTQEY